MFKILLIMLIAAMASAGQAANFGSTAKNDFVKIQQGGEASFDLLFWSADEAEQEISLSLISSPWEVKFERQKFLISRSEGNEMIYSAGYIRATSVNAKANSSGALPGIYSIIISAKSSAAGGDVAFAQERVFNLTVQVAGMAENATGRDNSTNDQAQAGDSPTAVVIGLIIIFIFLAAYYYTMKRKKVLT